MSLKFSMKRAARAWYLLSYSSRLGHVLAGSRIRAGTPSHSVGTSNPKTGSVRNGTLVSLPERAAFRSARVCRMLMRLAEAERAAGPAGINQPANGAVLQQPRFEHFGVGIRRCTMKGPPKQVLKVISGSLPRPISVPAILLV